MRGGGRCSRALSPAGLAALGALLLGQAWADSGGVAPGAGAAPSLGVSLTSTLVGTPTVATLRGFPLGLVANDNLAVASGYRAAGDGGGGVFRWDAGSNAADNGGTVIAPIGSAGPGRWLRVTSGASLTPLQFGARCDGNEPAVDTAAVGAALSAIASAGNGDGTVTIPAGKTCRLEGVTWSGSRLTLRGEGPASVLMAGSPTGPILKATAGIVTVEDLTVFAPDGYSTAGSFFEFTNSSAHLRRIRFINGHDLALFGSGCAGCGADDINADTPGHDGIVVDVSPAPPPAQQYGLFLGRHWRFQGAPGNTGVPFRIVSGDTVTLTDSNLAGFRGGVRAETSRTRSYLANLFFTNVLVDGAGGPTGPEAGWVFDGTGAQLARVTIGQSWSSGMGAGFLFRNVHTAQLAQSFVLNSAGTGVTLAAGADNVRVDGNTISANGAAAARTGDGIAVEDGTGDFSLTGNRIGPTDANVDGSRADTQRCGIAVARQSKPAHYRIIGNDLRGNATSLCGVDAGATAGSAVVGLNIVN